MNVAAGVEMLEIKAVIAGNVNMIHPALIRDENARILVDTGFPGQLPLIRAALEASGVALEQLTKIIVTHQDIDHIGSLPAILKECPQKIEVLASSAERPFIQGERRLLKLTQEAIDRAVNAMPLEMPPEMRRAIKAGLENPPKAGVDRTICDGEQLPECGGLTVIITPGHTPGHVCLYHRPSKILIAGDAMRVVDGQLLGPDPGATLDLNAAKASLQKLTAYDIAGVICYHGGLYKGDVNRQIAALAGD